MTYEQHVTINNRLKYIESGLHDVRFSRREKPLALYIFSNDKSKIQRMMDYTSSGGFLANDTMVHAAGKLFILYSNDEARG